MMKRRMLSRLALAAIATLTSVLSANTTQANPPAVNSFTCPTNYLTYETQPGVTWCARTQSGAVYELIAIDLGAGAKVRVVSDRVEGEGSGGNAQFHQRFADDWADYILDSEGPLIPAPERLTHVVNLGFMVNTDPFENTTPLSLPEVYTEGQVMTTGYAEFDRRDSAWGVHPKPMLRLGNPSAPGAQDVNLNFYLGNYVTGEYNASDVASDFAGAYDGTVGFPPWTAPSEANVKRNRTFVFRECWCSGTHPDMLYILLNTDQLLGGGATLAEMLQEIDSFEASGISGISAIQFDGGRSSQMYSVHEDSFQTGSPLTVRKVPEVLAVYSAVP